MSKARELLELTQDSSESLYMVFVFETLMNLELRKRLLKRDVEYEVDSLPGWKEISVESEEGPDYHTIIPKEGSVVNGHVIFVTEAELRVLDAWEDQYLPAVVTLSSGKTARVWILEEEKMKDFGGNIEYDLDPDDLSMIQYADELGTDILGVQP